MIDRKDIDKYVADVKALLPIYSADEKKFLKQLRTSIAEYAETMPDASAQALTEEFGTPVDIVRSYVGSMDVDQIIKKISIRKILTRAFMIFLVSVIILLTVMIGFTYRAYLDSKNTVVVSERTIISDE
jgi:hypothetical protein